MFKALPLAAIATLSVLAYSYAVRIGPFAPEFSRERFFAVKAAIKASPEGIIIFGDSIVQGAPLPNEIGGIGVVNAGVNGAGIDYFRKYASEFLGEARPKLIVLAVGINDSTSEEAGQQFRSRYQETVRFLVTKAPVALATITPVREGPPAARAYHARLVPIFNEAIVEIAGDRPVIDLSRALKPGNFTTDGVHLDAEGYSRWIRTMSEGITAALGS